MKRFNNILIGFVLILFFNSNNSFSQWIQINAPDRVVLSFSISETKIFAGTRGSLFYSSDDGNSWHYGYSEFNPYIYPLAINDTIIFIGSTSTGVYRSTDGCQSWVQVNNGLLYPEVKVLIKNDNFIFAGVFGGIFRSSDLGSNWTILPFGSLPLIATLAGSEENLYALKFTQGNTGNSVYRSTDNGMQWAYIFGGTYQGINVVSTISALSNYVNMGVSNYNNGNNSYILYSSNYGDDWIIPSMGPPTDIWTYSLVAKDTNVFAGTSRGVFLSQDHGDVWIPINEGLIDTSVSALVIFNYHIFAATHDSTIWKRPLSDFGITSVNEIAGEVPQEYYLSQNYPNPFNPRTTISFSIPQSLNVELKVFDILGNEMVTLLNEYKEAGEYKIEFNAKNLTSGIYFYQLKASEFIQVKKMLFLK